MRERVIERHLVKLVKEMGGEVRKVQWIGRNGAPDRLVMLPISALRCGRWASVRTIWVELKATDGRLSAGQEREHKRMREMGQCVIVVWSKEDVEELLR
jgi:hypothetical protein